MAEVLGTATSYRYLLSDLKQNKYSKMTHLTNHLTIHSTKIVDFIAEPSDVNLEARLTTNLSWAPLPGCTGPELPFRCMRCNLWPRIRLDPGAASGKDLPPPGHSQRRSSGRGHTGDPAAMIRTQRDARQPPARRPAATARV